jgi:hypothetical protein
LEQTETNNRFGKFISENGIENILKSTESKITEQNTSWSVKTFNEWQSARVFAKRNPIPGLKNLTKPADINKWLGNFVVESRRKAGQPYPLKSLCMQCVELLRHFKENCTVYFQNTDN